MGIFGVIVMLSFTAQIHAHEVDDLIDMLNSEEGMNTFVNKLTDKLTNRGSQISGASDKAMDGTTLLKPSRAALEKELNSAEANTTQALAARQAAEAKLEQSEKQLETARSTQQTVEAKAFQEAHELTEAQSAQQTDEAKASQEAQELAKAQSAQKAAQANATQEAQKAAKAKSAKQTAEAEASHKAQHLAKAAVTAKAAQYNATEKQQLSRSETTQARSSVEVAEANATQEAQGVTKAKSEKRGKAKDVELGSKASQEASVVTAGETGFALMAQDAELQPSPQYLPVAMALFMFSGMVIMSRRRSVPSFPDASAGLLPATDTYVHLV